VRRRFAHAETGWCAKGDCKLRGFEQEGKSVFQGKVKRKKKEHGMVETRDETENDDPEDEVEGGGRACRQKGWWKWGCGSQVEHSQYDSVGA
jgi:hypothetical protein